MKTKEEIEKEYTNACVSRGHVSFQIESLHQNLKQITEKQIQLAKELDELRVQESSSQQTSAPAQ